MLVCEGVCGDMYAMMCMCVCRTSEFLWQEGHTAHSNETDAKDTALQALNMYRDMCKVHSYCTYSVMTVTLIPVYVCLYVM